MNPITRDRQRRKIAHYSRQARDWFTVLAGATLVAMALATLTMLAVILTGCTALTYEQQQAMAAQAKGCYCEGKNCRELKSAAGQAAIAAAGSEENLGLKPGFDHKE